MVPRRRLRFDHPDVAEYHRVAMVLQQEGAGQVLPAFGLARRRRGQDIAVVDQGPVVPHRQHGRRGPLARRVETGRLEGAVEGLPGEGRVRHVEPRLDHLVDPARPGEDAEPLVLAVLGRPAERVDDLQLPLLLDVDPAVGPLHAPRGGHERAAELEMELDALELPPGFGSPLQPAAWQQLSVLPVAHIAAVKQHQGAGRRWGAQRGGLAEYPLHLEAGVRQHVAEGVVAAAELALTDGSLEDRIGEHQSLAEDTVQLGGLPLPLAPEIRSGVAVPAGAGQAAPIEDAFELAVAQRDHLGRDRQLATDQADVLTLDLEIGPGRGRGGKGGQRVGRGRGPRQSSERPTDPECAAEQQAVGHRSVPGGYQFLGVIRFVRSAVPRGPGPSLAVLVVPFSVVPAGWPDPGRDRWPLRLVP